MPDLTATLDHLLSHGSETEILEFKKASNSFHLDKLGKYFSALSNEANLHRLCGAMHRRCYAQLETMRSSVVVGSLIAGNFEWQLSA